MQLKDIKYLNQKIYEIDTEISRNAKLMFISTLIFCSLEKDFWDISKLTGFINFNTSKSPIDDLIAFAIKNLNQIHLIDKTKHSVINSLQIISGVNTKLNNDRVKLQDFVSNFITNYLPLLKENNTLFLETLYMEVDKKAKGANEGITLTPNFAAQLMIDLVNLDYKIDVVADLASGTGLFSLLSYSVMINSLTSDYNNNLVSKEQYKGYLNRLYNSIIANDFDPKMVTLCLANFIIKKLNTGILLSENLFDLQKSSFSFKDINGKVLNIYPTKGILNPPYEDNYKPLEIVLRTIELLKDNQSPLNKLVVIIPPQKFGQNKLIFKKILDNCRLASIIKMQDDLFTDSGQTPSTSIFIFSLDREHRETDEIRYFDFSNSGYIYLKDSGMVDKQKNHSKLKEELINKVNNTSIFKKPKSLIRDWTNFYEINKEIETTTRINPKLVSTNKEEADITIENINIKRILEEKQRLIETVHDSFDDSDKKFENYLVSFIGEEIN
jgi:hypothetical protein